MGRYREVPVSLLRRLVGAWVMGPHAGRFLARGSFEPMVVTGP